MISLCLLTLGLLASSGDWDAVQRLPPHQRIEIVTSAPSAIRAEFLSASSEAIVIRDKTGEHSIARPEVRKVRVHAPGRRATNGLIGIAVGAAAGVGIGFAVCPSCANEGHGGKFTGPGAGIGAAIGALAFFAAPFRTIYQNH